MKEKVKQILTLWKESMWDCDPEEIPEDEIFETDKDLSEANKELLLSTSADIDKMAERLLKETNRKTKHLNKENPKESAKKSLKNNPIRIDAKSGKVLKGEINRGEDLTR